MYSRLTASGAYHSIRIHPDSRSATTFPSPYGDYQYKRFPFGLVNADSHLDQLTQVIPLHRTYIPENAKLTV